MKAIRSLFFGLAVLSGVIFFTSVYVAASGLEIVPLLGAHSCLVVAPVSAVLMALFGFLAAEYDLRSW